MVNLLGARDNTGNAEIAGTEAVLGQAGTYLHWYGKKATRPGRKMAHLTIVNQSLKTAKKIADTALKDMRVIAQS